MNRRTFIAIIAAALAPLKRLLAKKPVITGVTPRFPVNEFFAREWRLNPEWRKADIEMEFHSHPGCTKISQEEVSEVLDRIYGQRRESKIQWYLDHIHGGEFPKDMGEIK